ncbi:MAG: small multi-drug export protein [Ruminococcaceae bacterium]|nr:small multi-drug export protein [Oscillospiraceae bacterium]
MAETLANYIVDLLQNKIPGELIAFLVSLLPILELRGGLIAANLLGVKLIPAFIICFIGNMLPIPFILLFIEKIFSWLRDKKGLGAVVRYCEKKADKNKDKIEKYGLWGLLILVAIPLPGTGAWTGALVAALMRLDIKKSLPVIAAGVVIAGIIVSLIMYGAVDALIK